MARPPVTFGAFGTIGYGSFREIASVCRMLEELDFAAFYASDHLCGFGGMPVNASIPEPWTLLAGLSAVTERLRLGVLVTGVTYRHPPLLAKIAATADWISGGRIILGIGAAWWPDDHTAYGIPFPPLRERQERLEEAVDLIDGLWTRDRCTFLGKYYRVTEAALAPKPLQQPRPPILIAAVGDRGLDLTARRAQIWASVSTAGFASQCIQRVRERCGAYGREPGEIVFSQLFTELLLTDDRRRARSVIEERCRLLQSSQRPATSIQARSALESESPEEQVRGSLLIGDAAEMREQIQRYVDAGVSHIIVMLRPPIDPATVRHFRWEVMSAFLD